MSEEKMPTQDKEKRTSRSTSSRHSADGKTRTARSPRAAAAREERKAKTPAVPPAKNGQAAGKSPVPIFLRPFSAVIDKLLGRIPDGDTADTKGKDKDFGLDADLAIYQQEPLRARLVIRAAALVLFVFVMWAAFAELDEVTRGEGKVVPSRQLQVIESLDGGIVSSIHVKEGELVQQGQLLVQIDETRFLSSVRENRSQYLALMAKAARLRALVDRKPFVPPAEVEKEDPNVVSQERALYLAKQAELESSVSLARQQLSQKQQELNEARARLEQASQGYELTSKELNFTRPLVQTGAVSQVELLRLERDVARFRGERDMASAQISRAQAAISEAQRKIENVELAIRNDAGKELSDVTAKLSAITEGNVGLSDKVKQAAIRSPVKGTVKRLLVNTVGGVVQPGKEVVEIVPLEDALILEAKIQPRDIAFLHPGQQALVKFTAYDYAIYGGLEGKLEYIGSDSITDEKGNAFYIVRVRTDRPDLGRKDLPIIPGMVAEVDILTGKKTVLTYLMKPILRAKGRALSER